MFDPRFDEQEVTDEEDDSDCVCRGGCAVGFCYVTVQAADETDALSRTDGAHLYACHRRMAHQVSLESFRGKWVVLYFYPKDMTPGLHDRGT